MDLQAALSTQDKQASPSRLAVMVCFIIACGLLIGSLVSPSKAHPAVNSQVSQVSAALR